MGRADGDTMRFVFYMLAPVPVALVCLGVYGVLARGGLPSLAEAGGFLSFGLGAGYLVMGLQSAVFALLMLWLEKGGVAGVSRAIAAAVLGSLAGSSHAWIGGDPVLHTSLSFTVLGAIVGPLVVLLADAVQSDRRQVRVIRTAREGRTRDASR